MSQTSTFNEGKSLRKSYMYNSEPSYNLQESEICVSYEIVQESASVYQSSVTTIGVWTIDWFFVFVFVYF